MRQYNMIRWELAVKIEYRKGMLRRMEDMAAPETMLRMQRASIKRAESMMAELKQVEKGLFNE